MTSKRDLFGRVNVSRVVAGEAFQKTRSAFWVCPRASHLPAERVIASAASWWRVAWTLALGIQAEVIGFRACARTRKTIMRVSTITDAEAAARTTMNARRNGRRSESLMVLPVTAVISQC